MIFNILIDIVLFFLHLKHTNIPSPAFISHSGTSDDMQIARERKHEINRNETITGNKTLCGVVYSSIAIIIYTTALAPKLNEIEPNETKKH